MSTTAPQSAATAASLHYRTKKIEQVLRYDFTKEELLNKGQEMAEAHQEAASLEAELTTVKSQYKAKIDAVSARIGTLASNVTTGYEMRSVSCEIRFHDPIAGRKSIYRLDGAPEKAPRKVSEDAMTAAEMQSELPLESSAAGSSDTNRAVPGHN